MIWPGPKSPPEAAVPSLHINAISAGDCAVLRLAGEMDVYTSPKLRKQVADLAENGTIHVIADLRGVDFLDSTGLGALVGSLKRLRIHQGSLMIVTSGGRILKLFQITGLTHAFALHSCVMDAISADQHWQVAIAGEGRSAEEWCSKYEVP
jgi:anti-sigma B factor antagonist